MTALESLTELERAEFLDNEIEGLPDYFKLIFETFPKLQYLDNKDREGNDVELDNEDDILAGSLNSDNMEFPEDEKGDDYDDEEDDDEDYEEDDEEEEN